MANILFKVSQALHALVQPLVVHALYGTLVCGHWHVACKLYWLNQVDQLHMNTFKATYICHERMLMHLPYELSVSYVNCASMYCVLTNSYYISSLPISPLLLGAHSTRYLLPLVIRRTGYAKAARSLNMVHQSTIIVCCLPWYCLWILVKADKLISSLVPIMSGHKPPAVLRGPSWWTLVSYVPGTIMCLERVLTSHTAQGMLWPWNEDLGRA